MDRLARKEDRHDGLTRNGLRLWGLLFAALGICGRAVIQNGLLGMGHVTSQELLDAMMASDRVMVFATLGLVMQAVEACAVPIFALLLVEGVLHTGNLDKYLIRVVGLAFLCELPYNLAMSGSLWDASSRNPVFGLAFGLGMLYLHRFYGGDSISRRLLRVMITAAAVLWPMMLLVQDGAFCVILVAVFWLCREKVQYRTFIGCAVAALCSLLSIYYLAAPMAFLAIHFYRGEKGDENRTVNYLAYPALLLAAGLAVKFLV